MVKMNQGSNLAKRGRKRRGPKTNGRKATSAARRVTREETKKGRQPITLAVKAGFLTPNEESYYFRMRLGNGRHKKYWLYFTEGGFTVPTGNVSTINKRGEPESPRRRDENLVAHLKECGRKRKSPSVEKTDDSELHKFGSLSGFTKEIASFHSQKKVASKPGWDKVRNENNETVRDALFKTLKQGIAEGNDDVQNVLEPFCKKKISELDVAKMQGGKVAVQPETMELLGLTLPLIDDCSDDGTMLLEFSSGGMESRMSSLEPTNCLQLGFLSDRQDTHLSDDDRHWIASTFSLRGFREMVMCMFAPKYK